jgi:hypothetical protein
MWSFKLEQLERPDVVNLRTHGEEETRQEPLKEAQKDIDKMDKEVAEKMTEDVLSKM